jgi:hypothetical protein
MIHLGGKHGSEKKEPPGGGLFLMQAPSLLRAGYSVSLGDVGATVLITYDEGIC